MGNHKKSEVLTSKHLSEITPLLKTSNVKSKIAEIMIGNPITKNEFLENLNKVLLICSIKAELSDIELELIKDTYRLKYGDKLTSNEFLTAFQFNQSGLFTEWKNEKGVSVNRIEHFQVFGIEFMTKVLDKYLAERHIVELKNLEKQIETTQIALEAHKKATQISTNNFLLNQIIDDYYLLQKSIPVDLTVTFKDKFTLFNELADIVIDDEKIEICNEISISSAIRKRSNRLTEIIYDEMKFGERLALNREIEQLKKGRWSDKIETELKLLFEFELYKLELNSLPVEFCEHVKSHLV